MATIALIADVHGNHLALEAVLADIRRRGIGVVINLGDNLNGPLDPQRCADLLRAHCTVHVRGNGDRLTAAGGASKKSTAFAAARIDGETRRWLEALPLTASGADWLACHGSPEDDTFYLLEEVSRASSVTRRNNASIAQALRTCDKPLVFCAHTHVPRIVQLPDGRTIVNPGSVGLQAYADDQPFPHKMECGTPHARYAIVEDKHHLATIELVQIEYDWTRAAELAQTNGFPEWVNALLTGRVA